MFNLDVIANKNNKGDKKWPYRMLIIGPSGSGKANVLFNLMQKQEMTVLLIRFICMLKT